MYKMVAQAIMLSITALAFILFQSDGLRQAADTGDITKVATGNSGMDLANLNVFGGDSGGYSIEDPALGYAGAVKPWYDKIDPRKLWNNRPKMARFNTKTIKAPQNAEDVDLAAQLAAKGLDVHAVSVVKLK